MAEESLLWSTPYQQNRQPRKLILVSLVETKKNTDGVSTHHAGLILRCGNVNQRYSSFDAHDQAATNNDTKKSKAHLYHTTSPLNGRPSCQFKFGEKLSNQHTHANGAYRVATCVLVGASTISGSRGPRKSQGRDNRFWKRSL